MHRWLRALGLAFVVALGVAVVAPAIAAADPPDTHEYLANRPSGFWTSNRPAVGGAYRYRLLGIGVLVATGMGLLTWRIVRRATSATAGSRASPRSP